jgi:large subunit ribosomal protein L31
MKKDTHPSYTNVKIRIGKDIFETKSTYKGAEFLMDVDFREHPAWTGKGLTDSQATSKSVNAFKKKFAGLSF